MTKARQPAKMFDPAAYSMTGTEDAHQIALFGWSVLKENRDRWPELKWMFAIPNGGLRTKATAAKLRAMGLKSGVSDICLPIRRGVWPLLWIELKRPKLGGRRAGTTSDQQDEWISHFQSQGHGAIVCEGWEAARDTIIQYLETK